MNRNFKDWTTTQKMNVQRLQSAETKGRLDFVLYGDSISSYHYGYPVSLKNLGSDAQWKKYFGDLNAVPLAIPGDQIGNVLWRLQKGHEKPKDDPRVIGLLIGVNDILRFGEDRSQPRVPPSADRMKQLLEWVRKNMPSSAVIVCGLTPMTNPEMLTARSELTSDYKSLVATLAGKGMRIKYVECTASITNSDGTPKSADYLSDTVHLTAKAHDVELKAMRAAVDSFLGSSSLSSTAPTVATGPSKKVYYMYYIAAFLLVACLCFFSMSLLVAVR